MRDPAVTSRIMSVIGSRDTRAELILRSRLWAMGLRYRKHLRCLTGHPDVVFPGLRVTVFVDGDFWHGNAWRVRGLACLEELFPTKTAWWVAKITRNMARDRDVTTSLADAGWLVLRYWESQVLADPDRIATEIACRLEARKESARRAQKEIEE